MSKPTTQAGKQMLARLDSGTGTLRPYADARDRGSWVDDILAIEAEARAEALDALRERIVALRDDDRTAVGEPADDGGWGYVQWLREDAVLAILSGEGPAEADPPASAPEPLDPAAVLNHAIGESIASTPPRKKRK